MLVRRAGVQHGVPRRHRRRLDVRAAREPALADPRRRCEAAEAAWVTALRRDAGLRQSARDPGAATDRRSCRSPRAGVPERPFVRAVRVGRAGAACAIAWTTATSVRKTGELTAVVHDHARGAPTRSAAARARSWPTASCTSGPNDRLDELRPDLRIGARRRRSTGRSRRSTRSGATRRTRPICSTATSSPAT